MKHIIKIADLYGKQIRTRSIMEQLEESLHPEDEYLFDLQDVETISRSAADELYNIRIKHHIEIINMSSFVQKMFDAVVLSRFRPRQYDAIDIPIIECPDLQSVCHFLHTEPN